MGVAMINPTTSALAAALWDFDGTLADTEPLWIEAEFELIGSLGGTWSEEHAEQLVGNSLLDSGAYILNAIGRHDLTPAWVVDQLISRVVGHLRDPPDAVAARRAGAARVVRRRRRPVRPGLGLLPGAARRRR